MSCCFEISLKLKEPNEEDHQVLDNQTLANQMLDNRVLNNKVLDHLVLDHRVLDNEVLDHRVLDNQVLDHQAQGNRVLDQQVLGNQVQNPLGLAPVRVRQRWSSDVLVLLVYSSRWFWAPLV